METSEIKNKIEGAIKALDPQKLKIALDFLEDLRKSDEDESFIWLYPNFSISKYVKEFI